MQHHRRSASLGRTRPSPPLLTPRLRSSLSTHSKPQEPLREGAGNEPRNNRQEPWGQNLYRYNKSLAIKQIINDYFKEEALCDHILSKPPNRLAPRRTQRYRKPEPAHLPDIRREEEFIQSMGVEPGLSKTCHAIGWNTHRNEHLPPINETVEEIEDPPNIRHSSFSETYTESLLLRSSSTFSEAGNPEAPGQELQQVLSFENEVFKVLVVLREGRPVARVKEFKEAGMAVLEREVRVKGFGLPTIWGESTRNPYTYETRMQVPLKDQLCRTVHNDMHHQNLRLQPRPLFRRMAANGFQELRSLLRGFCQDLQLLQGRVINNKLSPENLFLTRDYKLCLAEWGYSSLREAFDIQTNNFETRLEPILRGDRGWFVSPEYLAPEVISELLGVPSASVWEAPSSPDIWSLGLLVFELMTLVPLWCCSRCLVVAKPKEFPTLWENERTGLLGVAGRDLRKLHERQGGVQRAIEREVEGWPEAERALGELVVRMVELRPEFRISLNQLVAEL